MTTNWLVLWTCLCSDVATDSGELSETCPGHGNERTAEPLPPRPNAPIAYGHRCTVRHCCTTTRVRCGVCDRTPTSQETTV